MRYVAAVVVVAVALVAATLVGVVVALGLADWLAPMIQEAR